MTCWPRRVRGEGPNRRAGRALDDDEGSILPLTFAYAALALVTVLITVDATSLYLAQRRLDAAADAASLAGADGFTLLAGPGGITAELTDAAVRTAAADLLAQTTPDTALVSATTPDGASARVTVATTWHPPVMTLFVPDGVALESTATTRTALR